jgi:hypothetical protein
MEHGEVLDALDRIYHFYRYIPKLTMQTLERGGRELALKAMRKEYPRCRMSGGRRTSLQVSGDGIRITKDGECKVVNWEDYLQYLIDREKATPLL